MIILCCKDCRCKDLQPARFHGDVTCPNCDIIIALWQTEMIYVPKEQPNLSVNALEVTKVIEDISELK